MGNRAWFCSKCNVQMVNKNVPTSFLKMVGFEKGYICLQCKAKFLTEEAVTVNIMGKEMRGAAKMD